MFDFAVLDYDPRRELIRIFILVLPFLVMWGVFWIVRAIVRWIRGPQRPSRFKPVPLPGCIVWGVIVPGAIVGWAVFWSLVVWLAGR